MWSSLLLSKDHKEAVWCYYSRPQQWQAQTSSLGLSACLCQAQKSHTEEEAGEEEKAPAPCGSPAAKGRGPFRVRISHPCLARAARKPVLLVRLIAEGARWRLFHTEGAADNRGAPGNNGPHFSWQSVEAEKLRLVGPEVIVLDALRFA